MAILCNAPSANYCEIWSPPSSCHPSFLLASSVTASIINDSRRQNDNNDDHSEWWQWYWLGGWGSCSRKIMHLISSPPPPHPPPPPPPHHHHHHHHFLVRYIRILALFLAYCKDVIPADCVVTGARPAAWWTCNGAGMTIDRLSMVSTILQANLRATARAADPWKSRGAVEA